MDVLGDSQPSLFPRELDTSGAGEISRDSAIKATLEAFENYMLDVEFTKNTRNAFASDLRLLGEFLGVGQSVGDIGANDLNDFLKWLRYERAVPCSQKSYARRVTTLKVYFKWLTKTGIFITNPALDVIQVPVSSPLPDLPSAEAINKALVVSANLMKSKGDQGGDSRPNLLLTLLLDTGIKKSETMSIVLNHINSSDPDSPFLFIRYKQPKNRHKERKIPLDPEWIMLLDLYIDQYEPRDFLFTCTARNLEYVLADIGDRANLPKGSLSFENLRWISALRDYVAGVDHTKLRHRLGIRPVTWRETKSKLDQLSAKGVNAS